MFLLGNQIEGTGTGKILLEMIELQSTNPILYRIVTFTSVFGPETGNFHVSALKMQNRSKYNAFSKIKGPKMRDIKDFKQDIHQKNGSIQLKSAHLDSLHLR
jgi:hypothetical protein